MSKSNIKKKTKKKKKKNYVGANIINIYAKFQFHPPFGFGVENVGMLLFVVLFSNNKPFGCHGHQSNQRFGQHLYG